ncbi:Flp family type IVb pilin [Aliiroseovarius sp. YM-037]|uniref:Flp family type IVb pilin n=1 Tax=Aliiroseovarius sp. YM-037 TaxID=3341728 RepID=UPI003A813301
MNKMFAKFLKDESGAVTVDWVILTAGIVGLAIAVAVPIGMTTSERGDDIGSYVDNVTIATY